MKMNTSIWSTNADIEAAGCGYPDLSGYERPLGAKLSDALPFMQKTKAVKNGVVLGINPFTNDIMMHDGPENVLVMGPARSGKSINTTIPTSLLWQRSFFSFEKSSDIYYATAAYRKNILGNEVLKFSPLRDDSAHWNPFGEVRLCLGSDAMSADIRIIAESIIYCTWTGLSLMDHIHQKAASFLSAIIAYFFAVFDYRGIPFMSDIVNFVFDNDAEKISLLLQSSYPCPDSYPKASSFLQDNEVPSDDMLQIIKDALKPYSNSMVDQNTRSSDFRLLDLIDSYERLSLYYCLDCQWQYKGIASLFVNLMFYKFSLTINPKENLSKCLVMLADAVELSYLPLFNSAFLSSMDHGVRTCLEISYFEQMEKLFGSENQIAQHCGVHVYFKPGLCSDESTLTAISNLSVGKNFSPDELLRLDLDKVIVFIEGHKPILARKLRYFDNPWLKKMSEVKL